MKPKYCLLSAQISSLFFRFHQCLSDFNQSLSYFVRCFQVLGSPIMFKVLCISINRLINLVPPNKPIQLTSSTFRCSTLRCSNFSCLDFSCSNFSSSNFSCSNFSCLNLGCSIVSCTNLSFHL